MQHGLIFSFLITLASYAGIELAPYGIESHWSAPKWETVDSHYHFSLTSTSLPTECASKPNEYVDFPVILQGIQKIWFDDKLFLQTGGQTLNYVKSIVGQPVLYCKDLINVKSVRWEADTPTQVFAQVQYLPYVTKNYPRTGEISSAINILGGGAAFMMAIVSLLLFRGNSSLQSRISMFFANLGASLYSGIISIGMTGLWIETLPAQKLALVSVWVSVASMFDLYRLEGYVNKWPLYLYMVNVAAGIFIVLSGTNSDGAESGTFVIFPGTFLFLGYLLFNLFTDKALKNKGSFRFFYLSCPVMLSIGIATEMLSIWRVFIGPMILPLGIVVGLIFLILGLNEKITATYKERDYLRLNLENEVEKKTAELASTLNTLIQTQAQVVQNAKLASVGILAAGLAHEMNNALNFMTGAMTGFRRLIFHMPSRSASIDANEIMSVMDSGLKIATNVVKSLRSHTGINQAKFRDLNLKTVVDDTITLVKSRIYNVEISVNIPADLEIHGSVSGFHQIVMNLILNAVDALDGKMGVISISAVKFMNDEKETIKFTISDTGRGISSERIKSIFDPFYTTKEAGKGSGLGLYIVKNEIESLGGTIQVISEESKGTSFILKVPRRSFEEAA